MKRYDNNEQNQYLIIENIRIVLAVIQYLKDNI